MDSNLSELERNFLSKVKPKKTVSIESELKKLPIEVPVVKEQEKVKENNIQLPQERKLYRDPLPKKVNQSVENERASQRGSLLQPLDLQEIKSSETKPDNTKKIIIVVSVLVVVVIAYVVFRKIKKRKNNGR